MSMRPSVIKNYGPKLRARLTIFIKLLFVVATLLIVGLPIVLLENEPTVEDVTVASADDIERSRQLYRRQVIFSNSSRVDDTFDISTAEINSVAALLNRARPNIRGRAESFGNRLHLDLSIGVWLFGFEPWINLDTILVPSETGLELASVQIGRLTIPTGIAYPSLYWMGDLWAGNDIVSRAVASVKKVSVVGESIGFKFLFDPGQKKQLVKLLRSEARTAVSVDYTEEIRTYVGFLEKLEGTLTDEARISIYPYLKEIVEKIAVRRIATGSESRAAVLALATYCGHVRFQDLLGKVMQDSSARNCSKAKLMDRIDLRLHFAISAGLTVLDKEGSAFAVGEAKELLDSRSGGSGFSFDDLLADRAGIKFATFLMDASDKDIEFLRTALQTEADIMPTYQGLPNGISQEQFESTYKNVEGELYKSILQDIDMRLERLPIYRAR